MLGKDVQTGERFCWLTEGQQEGSAKELYTFVKRTKKMAECVGRWAAGQEMETGWFEVGDVVNVGRLEFGVDDMGEIVLLETDPLQITRVTEPLVVLRNVEGIARLSGVDQNGLAFSQWEMDWGANHEVYEEDVATWPRCRRCDEPILSGWVCMDGGEDYCNDCVVFAKDVFPFARQIGEGMVEVWVKHPLTGEEAAIADFANLAESFGWVTEMGMGPLEFQD